MIKVTFQTDKDVAVIDYIAAKKVLDALNKHFNINGTIGIRITNEQVVQELNYKHAGNNYATDVLSFPYLDIEEGELYKAEESEDLGELGDIVISRQHVSRQAAQAGTDEPTELALLTLHGLLHILGYDHQSSEDKKIMDNLQADIMRQASLTYRSFKWQKD